MMKTKNIFKTVALAMLMPAMLLTSACSNQDDIANTSNITSKGYALPVTVNVTRGDGATRATYNESTRKLEFSEGDKLFVSGNEANVGAGSFAGTLEYDTEKGTFSGTIYTENEYPGTANALFSQASDEGNIEATLLPNGYDANGSNSFLYVDNNNTTDIAYDDAAYVRTEKAFVASGTAKATGVEQLSFEYASGYSDGFALTPLCTILNFTISGLATGEKNVALNVTNHMTGDYTVTGSVTPNASGVATFAIGVPVGSNIKNMENNLTIGSSNLTLSSSTTFTAGKIYNITRGTGAIVDLATINENYTASNGVTLTGTLASNVQISIADGATVILNGVSINATGTWDSDEYAGITCLGDATIILSGTNTVKGFYENYPGIQAAAGKTLIINGTGSLTASSNGYGAGIGGGYEIACGNIEIQGGTITATGGDNGAGIGSGASEGASCGAITISGGTVTATGGNNGPGIGSGGGASCGTITISGGTVTATGGDNAAGIGSSGGDASCGAITIEGGTITATGGDYAAGIGSGLDASCGTITITSGVTSVTATKGSLAPNSIGAGYSGSCGTVTIGGVETGNITESPYTYQLE